MAESISTSMNAKTASSHAEFFVVPGQVADEPHDLAAIVTMCSQKCSRGCRDYASRYSRRRATPLAPTTDVAIAPKITRWTWSLISTDVHVDRTCLHRFTFLLRGIAKSSAVGSLSNQSTTPTGSLARGLEFPQSFSSIKVLAQVIPRNLCHSLRSCFPGITACQLYWPKVAASR